MIRGACLCGAVRWEFEGSFGTVLNCHCSMCRKHHGSAFATFTAGPASGFRWVSGEKLIRSYDSSEQGRRSFCTICGSKLPGVDPGSGLAFMPLGNLEGDIGVRPQMHLFVGSKAPWYPITDALPQHEAYPPEFGAGGVERPAPSLRDGVVSGGCLCGDVAYEITAAPLRMYNCHCSRCQRARSAAHATNAFYPLDAFRWTRSAEQVTDYALAGARFFGTSFCSRCGGMLPRPSPARGVVSVPAGSLDTDPGARPSAHIFAASKASWFDITDSIPQFPAGPPG